MNREETEQLHNIQEEIDGLTAIYLAIMNKEYSTMTFSITLNEEKRKDGMPEGSFSPFFVMMNSYWSDAQNDLDNMLTKKKPKIMQAGFSIDAENALSLIEKEIKRLVALRAELITKFKTTYKLPKKGK